MNETEILTPEKVIAHIRTEVLRMAARRKRRRVADRTAYLTSINGRALVSPTTLKNAHINSENAARQLIATVKDNEIVAHTLKRLGWGLEVADARHRVHHGNSHKPAEPFIRFLTTAR